MIVRCGPESRLATGELLACIGIARPLGLHMTENRTRHERALPNYENAVVPRDKLERYCLDSAHVSKTFGRSSGKDKARVFKARLGFGKADWELLKNRILEDCPTRRRPLEMRMNTASVILWQSSSPGQMGIPRQF